MKALLLAALVFLATSSSALAWISQASYTQQDIRRTSITIERYVSETNKLPRTEDYWIEMRSAGFAITDDNLVPPMDQWNQPLRYRVPGKHGPFDLYSIGKDGVDDAGQRDDISNWAGINEGYYWKSQWPGGRAMIRWGKVIGLASLFLGLIFPLRLIVPLSWTIIAFGYMVGNQMLLHPGHVPSHNNPLLFRISITGVALLSLLATFTFNFRKYVLRKRTTPLPAALTIQTHP
jgi:hypothetical protein